MYAHNIFTKALFPQRRLQYTWSSSPDDWKINFLSEINYAIESNFLSSVQIIEQAIEWELLLFLSGAD